MWQCQISPHPAACFCLQHLTPLLLKMKPRAAGRSKQNCSSSAHGACPIFPHTCHLPHCCRIFILHPLRTHSTMELECPCGSMQQESCHVHVCRRQISRDKATNVARAMSNLSSAIIFGGIFWRMGRSQTSIQDRMGLMQVRPVCQM